MLRSPVRKRVTVFLNKIHKENLKDRSPGQKTILSKQIYTLYTANTETLNVTSPPLSKLNYSRVPSRSQELSPESVPSLDPEPPFKIPMARILLTRSLKKPASEDNPIWPAKKYSKNKRQPRKIIPAAHKDKARTCDDVDNRVELRAGATCHPVTERAKLFPLPSLSNANLRNFSRERRKKMGWTPRTAVQGGGGGGENGRRGWLSS